MEDVLVMTSATPITMESSDQYNFPNQDFLEETREAMDQFLELCVPLHMLALQGNWPAAKQILARDVRLKHAAIAKGLPTVLHIAAGASASAGNVQFVKELLDSLEEEHTALQDFKGNTAFCFAAASGNLPVVEMLLQKNPQLATIRGGDGLTPLHFAALQGRCQMTLHLFDKTKEELQDKDLELLFFTCINTGNYGFALKLVKENGMLALARDDGETALHLLAKMPSDSCCCPIPESQNSDMINPGRKQQVIFQLVKSLWGTILKKKESKKEILAMIREPWHLLFSAAEVGNVGFLSELISAYPNLIWETDEQNRSIIHIAVQHRHASIYNLIHEIGNVKDMLSTFRETTENNTLLHLSAKLAPPSQLESVSGAAFQMCLELQWFKEVKKIMQPAFLNMKNSESLTADELFSKEHAELRKKGESWMKDTANYCMLVSTVIATAVFAAAISVPGGISDDFGKPHYLGKTAFLVFAIADASAFILSATSILIFLSILVSRYAQGDFYKSLPLKLISGLATLFFSITSMMVAFGSSFFITYYYSLKWIPGIVSAFACLPILLFMFLQYSLWKDIVYSTYHCKNLFKPSKIMLYAVSK